MKYFGIFTRLLFDLSFFIDWVLDYFTLFTGIYEMSKRKYYEIPGITRKYFAKNMKYQKILENSRKEISGNTLKYHALKSYLKIMKN
jgi:hypothetical protein